MEARAKARYVRVTPRKARRVVDLIRGLPADEAQAVLAFAPQSASDPVGKVLASAIANADARGGRGDRGMLWVRRAWVDEGPTLKRFSVGPSSTQARRTQSMPRSRPPPWSALAIALASTLPTGSLAA